MIPPLACTRPYEWTHAHADTAESAHTNARYTRRHTRIEGAEGPTAVRAAFQRKWKW